MIQERGPSDDEKLRLRLLRADLREGLDDAQGVLALLEATHREEDRTGADAPFPAQSLVRRGGDGAVGAGIDTVADIVGAEPVIAPQGVLPEAADAQKRRRLEDRAVVPIGELRLGELVEMVDGADEGRDQATPHQGGERVAADRVLGVEDVEVARGGRREMALVVGDARTHQFDRRAGDGPRRHWSGPTTGGAEKAPTAGIGRVDDRLVAEIGQRLSERERVHDAPARVGGMRQDRDAQTALPHRATPPQPISGLTAKSQTTASAPASAMRTTRLASTDPIAAAAMTREAKRSMTAATRSGAMLRM